jgi:hypothetical protein
VKRLTDIVAIGFVLLLFLTSGCNRATLRIPGASATFPETATHYEARTRFPYRLVIEIPSDDRARHYGEHVAGTKWTGCATDALWGKDAAQLIQERLVKEFAASGLFTEVTTNQARPGDLVLKTDVYAFCSQVIGFLYDRVAGITSLQISMERDGKILMDEKFDKVITDADPEYTGSQVTFIEQAMRVTMSDSLREVMKDALKQCEAEAENWPQNNSTVK